MADVGYSKDNFASRRCRELKQFDGGGTHASDSREAIERHSFGIGAELFEFSSFRGCERDVCPSGLSKLCWGFEWPGGFALESIRLVSVARGRLKLFLMEISD